MSFTISMPVQHKQQTIASRLQAENNTTNNVQSSQLARGSGEVALFNSGVGRSFLTALRTALKKCFGSMYRAMVKNNQNLAYAFDQIDKVCPTEAETIQNEYPVIVMQYRLLMIQLAKTQFDNSWQRQPQKQQLKIAPFTEFITSLLQNIAQTEEMRFGAYFSEMKLAQKNAYIHDMILLTMSQSMSVSASASDNGNGNEARVIYGPATPAPPAPPAPPVPAPTTPPTPTTNFVFPPNPNNPQEQLGERAPLPASPGYSDILFE
jgi:hypothetical protein